MIPRSVLLSLVALSLLMASSPGAEAKELDGRFGLGLESSLGAATGLALRYYLSDAVAVSSTLGVDLTIYDAADGQSGVAPSVVGSLGVAFPFARSLHANLGLGARLTLGWRSLNAQKLIDPTATATKVHVALEIPLFVEFFLSDHFSIGASTGILINFVPSTGPTLDPEGPGGTTLPGSVGIGFGAGSVTATFAILYYF